MPSFPETWRGDVGGGATIEIPWERYCRAPAIYRNDPFFWQAQSPWEDDPSTPASIPPDRVTSRCKLCLRGYVFSPDNLAWLATAFSLPPCGHTWSDIVPVLPCLSSQTQEGRLLDPQKREVSFETTAILEYFQTLSQRWDYIQQELRKKIGDLSRSMSDLMEDIGRKNAYDQVLWLVAKQRVPKPTVATVSDIHQSLEVALSEATCRHATWTGPTIGQCQARGAVETSMVALAQFAWFFPLHLITQEAERRGCENGTHY